jgi:DNA-binding transcriptional MocR family regulator
LPSTLQLARSLQVDWDTANSALATLQADGVLRAGSGRMRQVAGSRSEDKSLLSHTLILLSQNPESAPGASTSSGRPQCVDEGAWEEARRQGLHHLVFHPSRLLDDEFEKIIAAGPRGVVVTDLFGDWEMPAENGGFA